MHSILHAFTHSVVWASVIASAFVALVVTLVVEYFAKPGLEARKDRILEDRREQRAAIKDMRRACFLLVRLAYYLAGLMDGTTSVESFNKAMAEFSECTVRPFEVIRPPEKIEDEWQGTIVVLYRYSSMEPEAQRPKEITENFPLAFARLNLFHSYFTTAKWHVWRRHKLIKKIKTLTLDPELACLILICSGSLRGSLESG
jgi:hypothetical protein